ncbi:FadR family transcriptional regulator [Oscillibacter hominis]|uniref:FadR family transcriptional regulator n=1 Tax=Oscillibacter hominis TaxID=2763056 RepID=A0A7G9B244_9FIRM|nr:FadR/GntR family transcriptional regulator [Oscillibacter hominis]QNL43625.1 FadR family transcriptional regulator [Oscillibacter hominis]
MADGTRVKRSEQAANWLYEKIVYEREFEPGRKLPNENDLSAELHVSRTTLREAISCLVAQGILEIRRGKGTFVSDSLPQDAVDFSSFQRLRSRVRAKDLFEMRLIFEPETAALACQRATDAEIEQICRKAEKMEEASHSHGDWAGADQEFHMAIARASHNEYMRTLYPIINNAVNEIMQITASQEQMQRIALSDNKMILAFLTQRDAEGAKLAMRMHMRHLLETLQA